MSKRQKGKILHSGVDADFLVAIHKAAVAVHGVEFTVRRRPRWWFIRNWLGRLR